VRSEKQANPPLGSHCQLLLGVGVGVIVGKGSGVIVGVTVGSNIGGAVAVSTGEITGETGVDSRPEQPVTTSKAMGQSMSQNFFIIKANSYGSKQRYSLPLLILIT
jgi:hypothetical protein